MEIRLWILYLNAPISFTSLSQLYAGQTGPKQGLVVVVGGVVVEVVGGIVVFVTVPALNNKVRSP
jgi:hypothetical protein